MHENKYAHAVAPLERLNQWGAAKQAWEAALTVLPQSLVVRIGAANARYALGDRSGAAQMLESAVTQHPAAAEAHNNLAHVLGDLGQSQRALRHAHRAVALGGNNVATFQQTLKELKDRSSTGAQ
ncbi:MAG: hypothetical protein HOI95_27110 [Chromatiales bacterium]|nr:hypothetical protein [Chromatiales bacterium]